jgi:eukaryotic-like serine/threonine-protein kinase
MLGHVVAGKYRLDRIIGRGGMGTVYEARHVELGRRLAVKIAAPTLTHNREFVTRFRREARAASAIESEHVPQVLDMGVDESMGLFIAMEHLSGEDLEVRLGREGRLEMRSAARVGLQLGRALVKAHRAGVLHRDIKPANVFLSARDDGSLLVKLLDFGVSKLISAELLSEAEGGLTGTMPIGTVIYMAPEQAEGCANIDARADLWSVGAVMFEMLAGRPPHEDLGSPQANLVQLLSRPAPALRDVAPWVPEALASVVDRLLKRDPMQRTANAQALVDEILAAYPDAGGPDSSGAQTAIIVTGQYEVVDATQDTSFMQQQQYAASGVMPVGSTETAPMPVIVADRPTPTARVMAMQAPRHNGTARAAMTGAGMILLAVAVALITFVQAKNYASKHNAAAPRNVYAQVMSH